MIALWLALALATPGADLTAAQAALDGPIARQQLAALHEALIDQPAASSQVDAATGALARRALTHPDARVRRIAVQAVRPWVAPTVADPPGPRPVPFLDESEIAALARDPDPGVRRQTVQILRSPHAALDAAALGLTLTAMIDDPHAGVRAAALRALPDAVRQGLLPAERAFDLALGRAHEPIPAGRSACNQIARLAPATRAHGVPIAQAFARCLEHHPERAWAIAEAWRDVLPVHEAQVRRLLYETDGLSPPALRRWVELDRRMVERVLDAWPPTASEQRLALARRLLATER